MRSAALRQALKAAAVVALVPALSSPHAQAGTPWWCTCHGEAKRFIASTHVCEHDAANRTGRQVKHCTRAQLLAWNRKACKLEGCTPRQ